MIVNTGSENDDSVLSNGKNGSPWTVEEKLMLYHLKVANKTHKEIADLMSEKIGRRIYSENLIHKKWRSTDWVQFLQNQGQKEDLVAEIEERELEKQKIIEATLSSQEKFIRREQARTDLIIEKIQSAIYRLPKPKQSDLKYSPHSVSGYREEHMGLLLSDLHIGASYTLEETGGLSEFNLAIFHERLERLKSAVIEIYERHSNVCNLPVLHVFCLGDIVAGMNDAGSWSSNYIDLDIYDQMFEGVAALRDCMSVWSNMFQQVKFYGIFGNHGRVGKKGMQKDSTNWDRICYEMIRISMENYDNIEWKIPKSWWLMEKIQNHNFYLTHGDGIRGSMGIPYYGVERAERSIIGLMPEKPDYMLLGHFHSPAEIQTNSSRIIMNGSFMGGDMYSLRDLRRRDNAEQKLFGIHEKKGVTWNYNIQLT